MKVSFGWIHSKQDLSIVDVEGCEGCPFDRWSFAGRRFSWASSRPEPLSEFFSAFTYSKIELYQRRRHTLTKWLTMTWSSVARIVSADHPGVSAESTGAPSSKTVNDQGIAPGICRCQKL